MANTVSNKSWPYYAPDEVEAVTEVLLSGKVNYWTGQVSRQFEQAYADYLGVKHTIAVGNGTLALDLAWVALDIGEGDEVIVTSRTFLASVSSIVLAGAKPVFADVDLDSQNITVDTIKAVITPKTKAIVCVHLAGWPCDMPAIMAFAREHNLYVIEDCAQAHGAQINGQAIGSFGDIAAFSFCQDKIMSTGGEGGLVATNNSDWWQTMWSYKDHGKNYDTVYHKQHPAGFRWLHESFGTNWRITEMQSAIGLKQLAKLDDWIKQRRANTQALYSQLADLAALRIPTVPEHIYHACYKAYVFVRPEQLKADWSRDRIMHAVNTAGAVCLSGSCSEVYLEKAFDGTDLRPTQRLVNAQQLGDTSLMFLVHPTLNEEDLVTVGKIVRQVVLEASLA
ncbi:DegT/DnrJ/EryC1/StrS family aminotransferase [Agitococcus lubricus]|uniref:dTDP-4-amino-4,6-dideoxygalactose transaminase n=1 Tax=Agitococcus lubricus TaxID=1077255 RepID=A0A2T5J0Y7_9GAMM|nr:DegT/DnrJ/EryC1/StrS aminotransferase family protein [Agitococcus lubricus]PTQ90033.1 dTDP-4-amino-4,6-dideoxygalactose transaminase [Agitococcus lubricus]